MNIKTAIENILSPNFTCSEYIKKISYNNKRTDKSRMESVTKIAYLFYVEDKLNDCLSIVDILSELEFTNYDYWTWIEMAIVLKADIALRKAEIDTFNLCLDKLNKVLDIGSELQKTVKQNVHKRFLSGESLKTIPEIFTGEDLFDDLNDAVIYLMSLLKMRVFIKNSTVSIDVLNEQISHIIEKVRNFIDEGNLFKLSPFK